MECRIPCREEVFRGSAPRLDGFQDYRDYLLEYYRWRKQANGRYSYRLLASRLGMDVSQVHRILHRRIHMPLKSIPNFVRVLGIESGGEGDFERLVRRTHVRAKLRREGR